MIKVGGREKVLLKLLLFRQNIYLKIFSNFCVLVKLIYSEKATKVLRNLHLLFVLCTGSQIIGGDFAKFCGLLRIYELYVHVLNIKNLPLDMWLKCLNKAGKWKLRVLNARQSTLVMW